MNEVKKLVIERARWFCGKGSPDSALVRDDGMMCCLGFYGCALGGDPQIDIFSNGDVGMLHSKIPLRNQNFWPRWLFDYSDVVNQVKNKLAMINDDPNLTKDFREEKIAEIFLAHGVEVEFV